MLNTDEVSALLKSCSDGSTQCETKNNPLQSRICILKRRYKWEIQVKKKDQRK